ncbi:hypothetical protein P153DRAFT_314945 [Dothidotthia symphoricarpi CBS 119687]|uniref:Uncharacterized protein n=1 Tax=Dothidotthia symphoricarpi CBS 119687 TaxID=1392245 RepID=A0A6A6AD61_9PLEO|nr:uncharacterized protein P153DRAFT_314945 [Dothidotthia symphoricarpi CBS 119687]KAF2129759.1 hypothetical protein P153DRAFT_314945 [Dothidotthia symphoricarpi CBS 119687]
MAVTTRSQLYQAEQEGEVSSCVANLIQAFTDGLNIFKRLRERRRKRKARKQHPEVERVTGAELQLSDSLKKGPSELALRYAQCYGAVGQQFAWGDSVAHASLAETLIRLNTGLVAIIASFLNHDTHKGKSSLNLDYKSLINLSDDSRRHALQSLDQLYYRLNRSQLYMQSIAPPAYPGSGSTRHHESSGQTEKEKRRHTSSSSSSRQRSTGPTVTRMPVKSSNHPQLVMVRPKILKKGSSTSSSSSAKSPSRGSSTTSPSTSPMSSPVQKYITMEPLEIQPIDCVIKGTLGGRVERPRVDSFDTVRPQFKHSLHTASEHVHHPTPKLPNFTPTPRKPSPQSSPHRAKPLPSLPTAISPIKRRLDKATPSSYTFASDSTKLGEIPQRHWSTPWDQEEAERLNNEAAMTGQPIEVVMEDKSKTKKGLRRFLKRGNSSGEAV